MYVVHSTVERMYLQSTGRSDLFYDHQLWLLTQNTETERAKRKINDAF